MSQDKIEVKDVTPKTFNPKTHKTKGTGLIQVIIYVREVRDSFSDYALWWLVLLLLFALVPWITYGERQAVLLDIGNQQFNFFVLHSILRSYLTGFVIRYLSLWTLLYPTFLGRYGVGTFALKPFGLLCTFGLKKNLRVVQINVASKMLENSLAISLCVKLPSILRG